MLLEGRIPLNPAEHDAVDTLLVMNSSAPVSIVRRDPGESGPLLVHVGQSTYEINDQGKVTA